MAAGDAEGRDVYLLIHRLHYMLLKGWGVEIPPPPQKKVPWPEFTLVFCLSSSYSEGNSFFEEALLSTPLFTPNHEGFMTQHPFRTRGFTLLELSLVLMIVGLMAVLGFSSWTSSLGVRKTALTRERLKETKDCLLGRMLHTGSYPLFGNGTDVTNASLDVDICLADRKDAWGGPLYFLEGRANATSGLAGNPLVGSASEDEQGIVPDPTYLFTGLNGTLVNGTAFVLISFGRDRQADNPSYGNLLTTVRANTMNTATPPNFHATHKDDHILLVTAPELAGAIP